MAVAFATGPQHTVAADRTFVEELIAMQNPCAELKTTRFGITIGIDKLEEVTLTTASATLQGNDIALSFAGRLTCGTSDAAVLTGNAATSVTAAATMSLADCSIATLDVSLSEFGGTFAPILQALAPALEQEIASAARPRLIEACHDFRGVGG